MHAQLAYYTEHSPLTDPGPYTSLFATLPDSPLQLAQVVQGLLIHKQTVDHYKINLSSVQRAEQRLRSVQQRLERMLEIDPSPLHIPRPLPQRQVGLCRDFAVLHVSLLRHKGIPARLRVGFAKYLDPTGPYKIDHWITEYWEASAARWILFDPQIDALQQGLFHIRTNGTDLRRDRDFYLAGSAWQLCRDGKEKSLLFRFNGQWKGMPCIRGNLLHDFQALNKIELGVFDYWDELSRKPETALTIEDKALLDRIATLTVDADANHEALVALFDSLPRTRRILSRLGQSGLLSAGQAQGIAPLQDSGIQRLEQLAAVPGASTAVAAAFASIPDMPAVYVSDDLPDDHPANFQHAAQNEAGEIIVRGARQHNLKNITVRIPRNKLVVVTGVSGSGKSSLAFDTIYAEGQRRYVESLSSYARQFMEQMEKPQVDHITGLSPSIAIEQKTISRNPRSTVGTVTEILDYLRVLYARLGTPHCPQCGRAVQAQSAQQITHQLARLPAGTRFQLLAPLARNRRGASTSLLKKALADGFTRARIDGQLYDLSAAIPQIDVHQKHTIELVVDRLIVPDHSSSSAPLPPGETTPSSLSFPPLPLGEATPSSASFPPLPLGEGPGVRVSGVRVSGVMASAVPSEFLSRLTDSVETTLTVGHGVLIVDLGSETILLSEHNACPNCDISFPALEPQLFSFNSPLGMCEACNGLGVKLQVDPALIIEHPDRSLLDGASRWYRDLRKKGEGAWTVRNLFAVAQHYGVDIETPWNKLPQSFRDVILYGSGGEKVRFEYSMENDDVSWRSESQRDVKGIVYHINRLFRQTKSELTRRFYMSFMSQLPCPRCSGERLNAEARLVTVAGKRLPEITSWSIAALHEWTSGMLVSLDSEQRQVGQELIQEIVLRLGFLRNVGLHYLTLDRPAPSLSGGEGQRIRLASQIGSGLVGVLYILDEPSIGLHSRDQRALLDTLIQLRDGGNTVLVVEHDEATMRAADWILDLGPGPGILGGELVAAGTPEELSLNPDSLTGRYLSGELAVTAPNGRRSQPAGWLTVKRARLHNLKEIDVRFPLGMLTCVTGVSGSGKSSLIAQTLYPALSRLLHNAQGVPGPHDGIDGLDQIDKVINITQDPIGRNPRSNPGTYAGVLNEIRQVFAAVPEARALGFSPARFSFNVKGGRCEECQGYGFKKVEMHFLADVWVKCKACDGQRFNRQTLGILYKGKSIADVLDMDVQEAIDFFQNFPEIRRILQTLHDVGLDYIKLGQSALTLSGGEAQRVKLAKELSRLATGRTLYILDEPTTGLHFADIQRLLDVLHRLVDAGNTVIVIEHNLDVIKTADWIIDLGPEGGEQGGYIVAKGPPELVASLDASYTGRFLGAALKK